MQSATIPMRNYTYALKAYNIFNVNNIACEIRHMTLQKYGCIYGVVVSTSYEFATDMLRRYNIPYIE